MGLSYWFSDDEQKGNFSNGQKDTFQPENNYLGIRLQQGVPLLDRDWNELEDIRRYQEMVLRKYYIGDGTPDDGFKITIHSPVDDDFSISAGRYLVDGFEVVNDKNTTYKIMKTGITPTATGIYTVYLEMWLEEISGPANVFDVKEETCNRHVVNWAITVSSSKPEVSTHHYTPLANVKLTNNHFIGVVSDLRYINRIDHSLGYNGKPLNISLREAMNAMILGRLPTTVDAILPNGITMNQPALTISNNKDENSVDLTLSGINQSSNRLSIKCMNFHITTGWNTEFQFDLTAFGRFVTSFKHGKKLYILWVVSSGGSHGEPSESLIMSEYDSVAGVKNTTLVDYQYFHSYQGQFLLDVRGVLWVFWIGYGYSLNYKFLQSDGTWSNSSLLNPPSSGYFSLKETYVTAVNSIDGSIIIFTKGYFGNNQYADMIWKRKIMPGSVQPFSSPVSVVNDNTRISNLIYSTNDSTGAIWLFWRSLIGGTSQFKVTYLVEDGTANRRGELFECPFEFIPCRITTQTDSILMGVYTRSAGYQYDLKSVLYDPLNKWRFDNCLYSGILPDKIACCGDDNSGAWITGISANGKDILLKNVKVQI